MQRNRALIFALVIQVVAQSLSGVWGAAIGGVFIGLFMRKKGAFAVGFCSAMVAAAMLLLATSVRGAALYHWAGMMGANFGLPAWGLMAVTLVLPALQAGGFAGGIGLLAHRMTSTVASKPVGAP